MVQSVNFLFSSHTQCPVFDRVSVKHCLQTAMNFLYIVFVSFFFSMIEHNLFNVQEHIKAISQNCTTLYTSMVLTSGFH